MAPLFTGLARNLGGFGFGKISVSSQPSSFSATGGNQVLTPGNGYKYHTFTTSGSFIVSYSAGPGFSEFEVLMVAGGGAAGPNYNSGAGGGGVVYHQQFPVTATTYPVSVGGGGAPPNAPGSDTVFGGMTAKGGGGGTSFAGALGKPGGSGGGAEGTETNPAGSGIQPSQNAPFAPNPNFFQYGNPGGTGTTGGAYSAAGGGGAGGAGAPAGPGPGAGGPGGPGIPITGFEYPIVGLTPLTPQANSPTNNHYGAGGGGWGYSVQNGGLRPTGGGGRGGTGAPSTEQDGLDGVGGGAGNNLFVGSPNMGGDGIVIIRYQL